MATAWAMTVLSTQAPILGKQILLRRRSADPASLCLVYGELALQAEKPWRLRCGVATADACHALYSVAFYDLLYSDFDCFISESNNSIALFALIDIATEALNAANRAA